MPDADAALLSAEEMLALYARRMLSPVDVLQAVTERIAQLNPMLNAFAVLNPRAIESATESEMRWRIGRPIGALDGVPCTVKDLVDVAGFPTRRGSRITDTAPVADDAPAVAGLKAAGAVIVGKTTTTEFGWKSPGDCPLHGITRNPHNTEYTTGGSSSGAGAAGAHRHRRRWLDPHSGGVVRTGGIEADIGTRTAVAGERVSRRVLPRPDDAFGARCSNDVHRDGALRRA